MPEIKLEYRIAEAHTEKGLIEAPGLVTHDHNDYWSYARHLPDDWDFSKRQKRKNVASRLLHSIEADSENQELDLFPLKDDQRASGIIYGENPLQNMFDITERYAQIFPEHEFYVKWGGGRYEMPGKGFAFYTEDEADTLILMSRVNVIAAKNDIPIEIYHRYGILEYQDHVNIDARFKSTVKDRQGLVNLLNSIKRYPHFFHELFVDVP